jgi:N-acylneuraminate cytidylyltransferase
MKTICVIPARGGSKRIPRKNVRPFCGKPMIAWSIEAARASRLFDRIVVSTDDAEIIAIAREFGAEAPFTRPADLADDHTPIVPAVRHAVTSLERDGDQTDLVCCLFATAPFVTPESLREGHDQMRADATSEFAFSAVRFSFPIFRAVGLQPDGTVRMFWPENQLTRSQDLPEAYHEAGQFFWARRDALFAHDSIYSGRCRMVAVPPERVQDIDTEDDWAQAQVLALHLNAKSPSTTKEDEHAA